MEEDIEYKEALKKLKNYGQEQLLVRYEYLDDAKIAKLETIRIVHGKGTGKLKTGIHNFLKTNPHVKSYRMGTYGEGEMGVTVVELK